MSLMSTLGKVAMGIIVAKGVGKMLGGNSGKSGSGSLGGLGGLLGGLTGDSGSGSSRSGTPDLGDLLGGLSGKSGGGGLGGILDSLGGGSQSGGGIGGMLNDALQENSTAPVNREQENQAEIMLRAMINAAKSDGELDQEEQDKITEHLGNVSREEAELVRNELNAPLDVEGFINDVPRGMEQQVYFMSLLAIDLDSNEEAHYLDQLARGLGLSHDVCNQIHEKLGAPALYS